MESINLEELDINEDKYLLWKQELLEKRESKKLSQKDTPEKVHTPRMPQHFIDDAAKRRLEARTAVHVEAQTTADIFQRIDEMLEAS